MKQLLLIFTLFCASYMTVNAQTNTWTGAGANTNWNTTLNWSLNAVPTAANDVVIPTGFTVNLNVAGTTKSIAVQGNSTFNMSNTLSILNASSVAANATVDWVFGSLTGGGALTNNGTFNLSSGNTKSIVGVSTFNNMGNFNILDGGDFNITDGVFNNLASGVIDMQGVEGNISYNGSASRILNNTGLIKRTTAGIARIQTVLNNDGGTISVSSGNLIFDFLDKNLNGGIYNVSSGSVLQWTAKTNVSGTLTGALNGDLAWTGDVSVAGSSTFNFSGSSGVSWSFGNLTGGGTLVNKNLIFLSSGNTKSIIGDTTLNNDGDFNILDGGDFNITDGIFNNLASGIIDMRGDEGNISYNGGASRILNNAGLIKRSTTEGIARIQTILNNNGGTITVSKGNLIFDFLDKNLNGGMYNVSDGSIMQWNSNTVVSGTLTGNLTGEIAWTNDVTVPTSTTVIFNFTGNSGVNWSSGNLTGGGTLVNKNLIFLSTGNTKSIVGLSTLNNEGDFNILDGGDLNITDGIFNNQVTGTIDMQGVEGNISYNGSASRILNNTGLIKRTTAGIARIQTVLNNNGGTITVSSGNLIFDFLDKNLNGGIYNVSSGNVLQWTAKTNVSGTLTGALNGDLAWTGDVSVAGSGTFNFSGSSGVSWSFGNLTGGGTLVNKNLIFLSSGNTKSIIGETTLNNDGDFNILDGGDFNITDGVFNNLASGIIDMRGDEGNISYNGGASRILNNAGLIKRSTTEGIARIQTILNNNGGTITVSKGNLVFDFLDKNLNGGIYNISIGSVLQWVATTNVSGNLTGALNGDLAWTGAVSVAGSGTFNFSGSSGVSWSSGTLTGGGTLVNKSLIFLSSGNTKSIVGVTTLNNEGDFNILDGGDLNITNGVFNNQLTGIIDLQGVEGNISYTGSASRILNNFGLIKRTTSGNARIQTILNNSGVIDAQLGTLIFSEFLLFTNKEDGIVKGVATITIANTANYTNNGTFAPGGSPGKLTVLGDFKSTATSVLDVELLGLVPITGYDVLAITGNAIFNGIVNVSLSFAPVVNNEFVIATTTGSITQCNLASTTSAEFNGMQYTFNVLCRNGNQVVLKVTNVTLGIDDSEISDASVVVFPNPTNNYVTLKNKSNIDLTSATLVDISGRILKMIDLKGINTDVQISLEGYAIGTYFLKIEAPNASIVKQVIKK